MCSHNVYPILTFTKQPNKQPTSSPMMTNTICTECPLLVLAGWLAGVWHPLIDEWSERFVLWHLGKAFASV